MTWIDDEINTLDREQLAMAQVMALLALEQGWPMGLVDNPYGGALLPILVIETPQGQLAWPIHKDDLTPGNWPGAPNPWDKHDDATQYNRLRACIQALLAENGL